MKIRSIQLTNFRKFVGTVGVDGITDGVNLLVGQNELGKSTLLEAINGVIFEKAKSQTERARSFRHFVNGTVPEVEMAFDLDGMRWTIRKRFAGPSGKAAVKAAVMVEDVARTIWLAKQIGEPDEIPADMVEKLHHRYTHEYGQ